MSEISAYDTVMERRKSLNGGIRNGLRRRSSVGLKKRYSDKALQSDGQRRRSSVGTNTLSLAYLGGNYSNYVQSKWLRSTECIPASKVFEVLEALRGTLIFKNATPEEQILLAKRLRYLQLEDGVYLIKEGEDEAEAAVFMIAAGRATISVLRPSPSGELQEVDIKDIGREEYFGEGRVLTGECAYASVRAKEGLCVYFLLRRDIDELVSKKTRHLMLRDMRIRKFQKRHLDNCFEWLQRDRGGMLFLAQFAKEQHIDGALAFYNDTLAFKSLPPSANRLRHARRIFDTYLEPHGERKRPQLFINAAQRKRLVDGLRAAEREAIASSPTGNPSNERHSVLHSSFVGKLPAIDRKKLVRLSTRETGSSVMEDEPEKPERASLRIRSEIHSQEESMSSTSVGAARARMEAYSGGIDGQPKEPPKVDISVLFDELLDQNAIPTITQDLIPKFIQSKFYSMYLNKLFPRLEATVSESKLVGGESGSNSPGGKAADGFRTAGDSALRRSSLKPLGKEVTGKTTDKGRRGSTGTVSPAARRAAGSISPLPKQAAQAESPQRTKGSSTAAHPAATPSPTHAPRPAVHREASDDEPKMLVAPKPPSVLRGRSHSFHLSGSRIADDKAVHSPPEAKRSSGAKASTTDLSNVLGDGSGASGPAAAAAAAGGQNESFTGKGAGYRFMDGADADAALWIVVKRRRWSSCGKLVQMLHPQHPYQSASCEGEKYRVSDAERSPAAEDKYELHRPHAKSCAVM